jgi:hypothetical protein
MISRPAVDLIVRVLFGGIGPPFGPDDQQTGGGPDRAGADRRDQACFGPG